MPVWPAEDVFRIAERGHSLHMQGRYREAVVIFEGLLAADPENQYCREALAAAWLALDEPLRALEQLDTLIRDVPGNLDARARRAEALLLTGDLSGARSDIGFLTRLLPESETRRLELALEAAVLKQPFPEIRDK